MQISIFYPKYCKRPPTSFAKPQCCINNMAMIFKLGPDYGKKWKWHFRATDHSGQRWTTLRRRSPKLFLYPAYSGKKMRKRPSQRYRPAPFPPCQRDLADPISAKLFCYHSQVTFMPPGCFEGWTSNTEKTNVEHRTSNIECWMKDKNKDKNPIKLRSAATSLFDVRRWTFSF